MARVAFGVLIDVPVGLAVFAAGRHLADRVPSGPAPAAARTGARLGALNCAGPCWPSRTGRRRVRDQRGAQARLGVVPHAGLLALSAALLASFGLAERRASAPLIAPGTLRSRTLVTGVITLFATTGILVGAQRLTSLFLQESWRLAAARGSGVPPAWRGPALGAGLASHLAQRPAPGCSRPPGWRCSRRARCCCPANGRQRLSVRPAARAAAGAWAPAWRIRRRRSRAQRGARGRGRHGLRPAKTGHEVGAAVGAAGPPSPPRRRCRRPPGAGH